MISLTLQPAAAGNPWDIDAIPGSSCDATYAQMRAMPGVYWVRGEGRYRGPREAIELVAATLERAQVVRVRRDLAPMRERSVTLETPSTLRDYQRDGVQWLAQHLDNDGAALLADEMGLGKSAQAIIALDSLAVEASSTLVICPAVVKSHWAAQIARWSCRAPDAWMVMSYEGAAKVAASLHPDSLIIDEAQYVSNPTTKRAKATRTIRSRARYALALTGTPLETRVSQLHNILDILHPGRWGGWEPWSPWYSPFAFQRRYCDGRRVEITGVKAPGGEPLMAWDATGSSNEPELAARLKAVMLRRTKAEVAAEMPPLTRVVHEVELPKSAVRSLARSSRAFPGDSESALMGLLSRIEGHKLAAAESLARDALDNGHRVLVFTTRRESARTLGAALGAAVVTSDDAANERGDILRATQCGVATIYSVTTGIDLTEFDVVIFAGLDYVPSRLLQAEARTHRIGQHRAVMVYYLVAVGTADEIIRERVIDRLETFGAIVGGDVETRLAAELSGSEEDLLRAIAERCAA